MRTGRVPVMFEVFNLTYGVLPFQIMDCTTVRGRRLPCMGPKRLRRCRIAVHNLARRTDIDMGD